MTQNAGAFCAGQPRRSAGGCGSLPREQPVPERSDDQGDAGRDEGPDGLEAGDGLGAAVDLLLEGEKAVDLVVDGLEEGTEVDRLCRSFDSDEQNA